jgi:hypothetical protein
MALDVAPQQLSLYSTINPLRFGNTCTKFLPEPLQSRRSDLRSGGDRGPCSRPRTQHRVPLVLRKICLRGEAKRTDAVVAASRTAGQLSAYCLSRVPDLSHCLRQALLGHAELVGPVLDLMGFQEADARPVCRSSLVRIVCHGWLPFRGNCSITEFVPYSSPFMLHRNSPLVGGMEQIRLSRDMRWAEPCASKEEARTTNPGRGMNGGR